jgi:predicted dehydrogenase
MIKWGIIGLGNMGTKFANSFFEQDSISIDGIASLSNLKKFGKKFVIKKDKQFKNYSDLLRSPNIDAVYISTTNNTHFNLVNEAIDNNKKILCEKPFVTNINDAKFIYNRISNKKNFFLEAIAYRSHPITNEILSIIESNEIGEIKEIHASFGFEVKKIKKKSRLFNKILGGGCILDLGCYPVSFAELFRKTDKKINFKKVSGSFSSTNVDDHAEIEYIINDNVIVKAVVSFKKDLSNDCVIYGTKKKLRVISPWLPEKKSIIEIIDGEDYYKRLVLSEHSIYANQLNIASQYFNKKIDDRNLNLVTIEKSIEIFHILDFWINNIKD